MSLTAAGGGLPGGEEAPLNVSNSKIAVIETAGAHARALEVSETVKEVHEEDKKCVDEHLIKTENVKGEVEGKGGVNELASGTNLNDIKFDQLDEFDKCLEELLNNDDDDKQEDDSISRPNNVVGKKNLNAHNDKVPLIIIRRAGGGNVAKSIFIYKSDEDEDADDVENICSAFKFDDNLDADDNVEELIYSDDDAYISIDSDCISLEADPDFTETDDINEELENKSSKIKGLGKSEVCTTSDEKLSEDILLKLKTEGRKRRKKLYKQRKKMLDQKIQSGIGIPVSEFLNPNSSGKGNSEVRESNIDVSCGKNNTDQQFPEEKEPDLPFQAWKSDIDAKDLELYVINKIREGNLEKVSPKKSQGEEEDKKNLKPFFLLGGIDVKRDLTDLLLLNENNETHIEPVFEPQGEYANMDEKSLENYIINKMILSKDSNSSQETGAGKLSKAEKRKRSLNERENKALQPGVKLIKKDGGSGNLKQQRLSGISPRQENLGRQQGVARGNRIGGLSNSMQERISPFILTDRMASSHPLLSPSSIYFERDQNMEDRGVRQMHRSPSPQPFTPYLKHHRRSSSPNNDDYNWKRLPQPQQALDTIIRDERQRNTERNILPSTSIAPEYLESTLKGSIYERIVVSINTKTNFDFERVIRFLTIQNRMMNIGKWEFLGINSNPQQCFLHFIIPPEEIEKLNLSYWKLCYQLSMVEVKRPVDLKCFMPDQVKLVNPNRRTFIRQRGRKRTRTKKKSS